LWIHFENRNRNKFPQHHHRAWMTGTTLYLISYDDSSSGRRCVLSGRDR
jgi:hypothetical protein